MKIAFILMSVSNSIANGNFTYAYSNEANQQERIMHESYDIDNKVYCSNSEKEFTGDVAVFEFNCKNSISSVVSFGDVTLDWFKTDTNKIKCCLTVTSDCCESKLDFYCKSDLIDSYNLYFAKNNEITYSSGLSLDTAKANAGLDLCYDGKKPLDNCNSEDLEIKRPVLRASSTGGLASGSVKGVFNWTDDSGLIHPLVGARVKVNVSLSTWSGTTYTDEYGCYWLSFQNIAYVSLGIMSVTVYADNGESIEVNDFSIYSKTRTYDSANYDATFDYTFSPSKDGDLGKAMIIYSIANEFANVAKEMNDNVALGKCAFSYPGNPNDGCYYNDITNTVTITSKARADTSLPHAYSSIDVIGHEYGHFIQDWFDVEDNPGDSHSAFNNAIDEYINDNVSEKKAKTKGLKLAWCEGWPTFWSICSQSFFTNNIKTMMTANDTCYTSYNGAYWDLDSYIYIDRYGGTHNPKGDADEIAISSILFKLVSSKKDIYDNFSISFKDMFKLVINNCAYTFYEFVSVLYNYGYDRYDLGKLLGQYNVCVSTLSIYNNYLDETPRFSWSTYMGSTNLLYNSFDLVILNDQFSEILKKQNIVSSTSNAEYTLSDYEWFNVLNKTGNKFYAYIVCRQTLSFTSGNYYSECFEFDAPTTFNRKVQIKANEWGFNPQYFFESNCAGHTNTTKTSKDLTIRTNRLRCGYIENSYVVLSPKRINAGVAYLELYFDKPVFSYMFGICLWSSKEKLFSYNSTAVVETMDIYGNWVLDYNILNDLYVPIKSKIKRYSKTHFEGIYGLRFVINSPAEGNENRGRICLDDFVFSTNPNDTSFFIGNYFLEY